MLVFDQARRAALAGAAAAPQTDARGPRGGGRAGRRRAGLEQRAQAPLGQLTGTSRTSREIGPGPALEVSRRKRSLNGYRQLQRPAREPGTHAAIHPSYRAPVIRDIPGAARDMCTPGSHWSHVSAAAPESSESGAARMSGHVVARRRAQRARLGTRRVGLRGVQQPRVDGPAGRRRAGPPGSPRTPGAARGARPRGRPATSGRDRARRAPAARRPAPRSRCGRRTARRPGQLGVHDGGDQQRRDVGGEQPADHRRSCGRRLRVARPARAALVAHHRPRRAVCSRASACSGDRRSTGTSDNSSVDNRTDAAAISSPAPARRSSSVEADPSSTALACAPAAATPPSSPGWSGAAPGRAARVDAVAGRRPGRTGRPRGRAGGRGRRRGSSWRSRLASLPERPSR